MSRIITIETKHFENKKKYFHLIAIYDSVQTKQMLFICNGLNILTDDIVVYLSHTRSYYDDVIMGMMASLITSRTIVYSTVCSDANQRKHQSSAPLAFVRGIHRGPGNSPHKWPVTRKMSPFDDIIMEISSTYHLTSSVRHTKSQRLNVSRLVLQLSLPNPLKPGVNPHSALLHTPLISA